MWSARERMPLAAEKAGKIAADEAGTALHASLRKLGIGDRGIVADAERVTTLKTRIISVHQQIVRIDHERRDPVAPPTEGTFSASWLVHWKRWMAWCFLIMTRGCSGMRLRTESQRGPPVKSAGLREAQDFRLYAYRGARVIVCNAKETGHYVGRAVSDDKSVEESGHALLPHFGCAAVVITRGRKGGIFFRKFRKHMNIPATSFEVTYARVGQPGIDRSATGRQVFDVTGAGDTVLSVLSLAIMAGALLPDAALLANTAAGVVVGKLGTASVSPEELAGALDETPA